MKKSLNLNSGQDSDHSIFSFRKFAKSNMHWAVWNWLSVVRNNSTKSYYFPRSYYTFAVLIDLCLRFTWLTKFSKLPSVYLSGDSWILTLELLEILRRSLWSVIRIEWEWINQVDSLSRGDAQDICEENLAKHAIKKDGLLIRADVERKDYQPTQSVEGHNRLSTGIYKRA